MFMFEGNTNDDLVDHLVEEGLLNDPNAEEAFRSVSRSYFFPTRGREKAYVDNALRTETEAYGVLHQSAPHMYAMIIEHLELYPGAKFLNVGSGTGYFSAIVAHLLGPTGVNHGVEVQPGNIKFARKGLQDLFADSNSFAPVILREGNAFNMDVANNIKYDRVYVGAQCPRSRVDFLTGLLADGGIMVVPCSGEFRKYKRQGDEVSYEVVCRVLYASMVEPDSEDDSPTFTIEREEDDCEMEEMVRSSVKESSHDDDKASPDETKAQPASSGFEALSLVHGLDASTSSENHQQGDSKPTKASPKIPATIPTVTKPPHVMISFHVKTMRPLATKLQQCFHSAGIRAWTCTGSLTGGKHWRREIITAIQECAVFVPLINAEWAASGECENEFNMAFYRHTHDTSANRQPYIYPLLANGVDPSKHLHLLPLLSQFSAKSLKRDDAFVASVVAEISEILLASNLLHAEDDTCTTSTSTSNNKNSDYNRSSSSKSNERHGDTSQEGSTDDGEDTATTTTATTTTATTATTATTLPSDLRQYTIDNVCEFVRGMGLSDEVFRVNAVNGDDLHEFEVAMRGGDGTWFAELQLTKLQLRKLRRNLEPLMPK